MKVILFGSTGMVGQGVLRECVLDPDVESILSIGRKATGQSHAKLREILRQDLFDLGDLRPQLSGYDACFFCLGVSSIGMKEQDYRHITYDLTLSVARILAECNSNMTFIYVSGTGTDSTERGRSMWAQVKGETENALLRMPFRAAYMFRPGYIQPLHGVISKIAWARGVYVVIGPFYPVLQALFPQFVTTTEQIGKAMLAVVRSGFPKSVLESRDINSI